MFAAFLTELILIAAVGNSGVYDWLVKHSTDPLNGWLHALGNSATVFGWRFVSGGGIDHLWYAQFAMIGTIFVVTALLVFAIGRGAVTFGRAFFGTWMAVIIATMVGRSVGGMVNNVGPAQGVPRAIWGVFGGSASNGFSVVAGVALGLITALITALVAVASRRTVGGYDDHDVAPVLPPVYQPPPWGTETSEPRPAEGVHTAQFPAYDDRPISGSDPADTSEYPRYGDAAAATTTHYPRDVSAPSEPYRWGEPAPDQPPASHQADDAPTTSYAPTAPAAAPASADPPPPLAAPAATPPTPTDEPEPEVQPSPPPYGQSPYGGPSATSPYGRSPGDQQP